MFEDSCQICDGKGQVPHKSSDDKPPKLGKCPVCSGSGKNNPSLHFLSSKIECDNPFVQINCDFIAIKSVENTATSYQQPTQAWHLENAGLPPRKL